MPGRQADYQQKRAGKEICFRCSCEQENRESKRQAEESGLPALTGVSDRQIAYGETCRGKMLEVILDFSMPEYERPHILAWLRDKTEAAWWCDIYGFHRGNSLQWATDPDTDERHVIDDLGTLLVLLYEHDTGRRI